MFLSGIYFGYTQVASSNDDQLAQMNFIASAQVVMKSAGSHTVSLYLPLVNKKGFLHPLAQMNILRASMKYSDAPETLP